MAPSERNHARAEPACVNCSGKHVSRSLAACGENRVAAVHTGQQKFERARLVPAAYSGIEPVALDPDLGAIYGGKLDRRRKYT